MSTNPLASFIKGASTVGGMEQAQTTALTNRLYREQVQAQYDAGESEKALAFLSNEQFGIYKLNLSPNGAASYTLREDWEDRYNSLQKNEPEKLGQYLLMDRSFGQYLSKSEDGKPVKRRNQKVFAPNRNDGIVATSVADKVGGDENLDVKAGKDYSYSIPVVNEKGLFGLKTLFGSDLPDDDQPISLTAAELQTALELVPAMHSVVINPNVSRRQSGVNDLIGQNFGAEGVGQNNVTFTGRNNTNAVIDVPQDQAEMAEFVIDDNSNTPSVLSLIKQMHEANKIEGKETVLASSGDQTQAGAPAPTPAPTPAPEKESIDTGQAPEPKPGNVTPRPKDRFNEWDRKFAKDYNFDGTPKVQQATDENAFLQVVSNFTNEDGSYNQRIMSDAEIDKLYQNDNTAKAQRLKETMRTMQREQDRVRELEAKENLSKSEQRTLDILKKRTGPGGYLSNIIQRRLDQRKGKVAVSEKEKAANVTKINEEISKIDNKLNNPNIGDDLRASLEQDKLNLQNQLPGATTDTQDSGAAVFTKEQTGQGDLVTDTFSQTFPEFEGLDKNQITSQVQSLMTSGEFAQRGFTQEQVTNIRTFLEQQNINNLDDMKQAVDQGVIQNPYLTSLSINLLLAGPDGMVGGESIADATEKMEKFITTGISTRDAKELTDSVQTQRQIDSAALKDFNALLKTRFDQNQQRLNDLEEIGEDFAKDLDIARAYIRDPENADAASRNAYNRVLNQDNYYGAYSDVAGGLGSYEQTDVWKNSPLAKAGRRPTVFDYAMFLSKSEAATKALGPKVTTTLNNNIEISTDIAAELMFSKMQGTANPFRLSEWLGDFARDDASGGLREAFLNRLVAVTDADGKIIKIAARDTAPDGTILEAEESAFFNYFADADIDLGQVQLVVSQLPTVGDKEFRTRN